MPFADAGARRDYQRTYQREWRAQRRADWFADKACAVCGSTDRLELDHIDPSQKVSSALWSWAEERRLAELAKCQVLCHDHHVEKTRVNGDYLAGEKVGTSRLTEAEVREARTLYASGSWTFREIGDRYRVHRDTIRYLVNRGGWAAVTLDERQ